MKLRQGSSLWMLAVLFLTLPSSARASDMTGAFVYVVGIGLAGLLVIGLAAALVLKFVFKCGHWVWILVLAAPGCAILLLLCARFFSGDHVRNYHSGPDLAYNGSHSVTVSADFRQKELDRAMSTINSPLFKQNLARYTNEPVEKYRFAIDLEAPRENIRRHFVTICVEPEVNVNTAVYEGIMFLFSKAVIEADPHPCNDRYTEPKRIR